MFILIMDFWPGTCTHAGYSNCELLTEEGEMSSNEYYSLVTVNIKGFPGEKICKGILLISHILDNGMLRTPHLFILLP